MSCVPGRAVDAGARAAQARGAVPCEWGLGASAQSVAGLGAPGGAEGEAIPAALL